MLNSKGVIPQGRLFACLSVYWLKVQQTEKNDIILLFVVTNSCEDRPRTNPFDPETELDSSEWMPSNLQVAWINDLQIKLTWTQEYNQVSGFRISTKEGSGSFTNCKWKMKNPFWR